MGNNIRIGKDFKVQWAINKVVDGERLPYDLVGKELQLYIVNDNGRKEVAGWKVRGNVILWTFLGKDQKRLGAYQLVLVENADKDGMVTVDTCKAFNLVAHSCEENVEGGSDIVIETVTLESEVALAPVVKEVGGESYDDTELRNAIADLQAKDTQTDAKLTELSNKVDNLPQGSDAFDAEGNYPLLHVGIADDLAGRGESVPASFGFRASGGKSIKDGRAYIKRIKGNSMVWNQKYPTDWSLNTLGLSLVSSNNVISISGTATGNYISLNRFENNEVNHIYLFDLSGASKSLNGKVFTLTNRPSAGSSNIINGYASLIYHNTKQEQQNDRFIAINNIATGDVINEPNLVIRQIDLTQMFGAGNEPTTIEDFYARVATLGVDLNAYNEGEVIHCNTESIKSVGDNAWDEQWEKGIYSVSDGIKVDNSTAIRTKHPIPILPNTEYYKTCGSAPSFFWHIYYDKDMNYIGYQGTSYNHVFVTPANAAYMNSYTEDGYGSTYKHDIMITLVHSGWKQDTDAGYQPYWEDILPLPIINKYFPQGMKSAGSAHDEIRYNKASGKWEYSKGRIKSVDLGGKNFIYNADSQCFKFLMIDMKLPISYEDTISGLLTSRYVLSSSYVISSMPDKSMFKLFDGYIYIKDSAYTDAASFKAAMQGVILYYESDDWEWLELDAEDQNFRDYYNVADFGTEMSQSSVPSTPFSADIIYQFNAVDMIREHEAEITELQKVIATMQAQLTSLIN